MLDVLGQVGALGEDAALVGGPGQGHALALGRDPVGVAVVGHAAVRVAVRSVGIAGAVAIAVGSGLGGDRLLAGRAVGSLVAPVGAGDAVTVVRLAHDGDVGLGVAAVVGVAAGGSGGDGEESGDDELMKRNRN